MGSFELVRGKHKYHVNFGKRIPKHVLKQHQEEIGQEEEVLSESEVLKSEKRKLDSSSCEEDLEMPLRKLDNGMPISMTKSECVESATCSTEGITAESKDTKGAVKRKRGLDVKDGDNSLWTADDEECSRKRPKLDQAEEKPVKKEVSKGKKKAIRSSVKPRQASLDCFVSSESSNQVSDLLDSSHNPQWEELDTLLIMRYGGVNHSTKIACFDLDSTLIETVSGRKFATGPTDWKFMKGVLEKLRSLHCDGFKIVIFTNQAKLKKEVFYEKIGAIASQLKVPILLMASLSKDQYRKPCIGMWEYLVERENGREGVDMETSFYVGDAAGRVEGWRPGRRVCAVIQHHTHTHTRVIAVSSYVCLLLYMCKELKEIMHT